jgi:hypothetical protein
MKSWRKVKRKERVQSGDQKKHQNGTTWELAPECDIGTLAGEWKRMFSIIFRRRVDGTLPEGGSMTPHELRLRSGASLHLCNLALQASETALEAEDLLARLGQSESAATLALRALGQIRALELRIKQLEERT